MRTLALIVSLLFSINLADANQQVLLRVQWQQLALQNSVLSLNEKVQKVQAITSLIDIESSSASQVAKTPNQIFQDGIATQAELAFAKWYMLKELGFSADEFRLVYVKNAKENANQVWLAWYQTQQTKIITSTDILDSTSPRISGANSGIEVLSVLDPSAVLKSRNATRTASLNDQDAVFL